MSSPNPYAIDADTLSGMKPLRKVVYSLGSNLGDRLNNLQGAVDALRDTPDVIVVDVSSVYETEPVGGPADSPSFLNLIVVAESVTGLVVTALATGLVFAKFSRSAGRMVFSRQVVISPVDGVPTLQLRFATGFGTRKAEEQTVMLRLKQGKETALVGEFVVD